MPVVKLSPLKGCENDSAAESLSLNSTLNLISQEAALIAG